MPEDTFRWVITGGVGIAVFCIIIMAVVMILLYKAVSKLRESVTPIIETAGQITSDNASRISAMATRGVEIATNVKEMTDLANDQAHRFAEVGRDLADRTKAQIARVDSVVDEAVEQAHHAGDNMKAAVLKPVREAEAVFAGLKAAVSSFAGGHKSSSDRYSGQVAQDEEMFI